MAQEEKLGQTLPLTPQRFLHNVSWTTDFSVFFFTSSSWYDEIGVNIQQVKGKKETQPYSMNFIHYIQII